LLGALGVGVAGWLLWTSWERRGRDRPGWPTAIVTGLWAVGGLVSIAWTDAAVVWVYPGILGWLVGAVTLVVVLIWGLVLLVGKPRPRGSRWLNQTVAWYVLTLGIPGTGLLVWLQGSDISFC
jgi:hypothetical protein